MSKDGWVIRSAGDGESAPVQLLKTDEVEYRLRDDPEVRRDVAGNLYWAPEGGIVMWRKAVTVPAAEQARPHGHYFKPVDGLPHVDVYRVLALFDVTDPALQHAVKKLLVAGGRGAGKDIRQDVQEAIDALLRWQEMRAEDAASRRA